MMRNIQEDTDMSFWDRVKNIATPYSDEDYDDWDDEIYED